MIKKQQEEVGKKEKPTQQAEKLSETLDLTSFLISQDEQEEETRLMMKIAKASHNSVIQNISVQTFLFRSQSRILKAIATRQLFKRQMIKIFLSRLSLAEDETNSK